MNTRLIILLRGHVRDGLNDNSQLYDLIKELNNQYDIKIYIHTWNIVQSNVSHRRMIQNNYPVTHDKINTYFKDLSSKIKHIIIDNDKNIQLNGKTEGIIVGRCPLIGWKNMWYGKHRIIEYIAHQSHNSNVEKLPEIVLNMRFDILSVHTHALTIPRVCDFIKNKYAEKYEKNKFIYDENGSGIDNIYIGSIDTQYKLINHFHTNLDQIITENPSITCQEHLVFTENDTIFTTQIDECASINATI